MNRKPCRIEGCIHGGSRIRELCPGHTRRLRLYGDPLGGRWPKTLAERFWENVDYAGDHCWLWNGGVDKRGYGWIAAGPQGAGVLIASRVSWELANGTPPAGMVVRHTCDNPPCVRPDHLLLGTVRDNVDDMTSRGRQRRGEGIHSARLTGSQVIETRQRHAAGETNNTALGREFGVSRTHIGRIVTRKKWKHIQ